MTVAPLALDFLRFWQIFWIDASSNKTARQSFQDIATVVDPEAKVEKSMESILQWISRIKQEWLLVFDNAEPDVVTNFTPPGDQGNLLITSRNPDLRRNVPTGSWAMVDQMGEEDAISLLLQAACLDEASDELRQASRLIVNELCLLPLAIDQAGAAITCGLCDVHSFLQLYSQHHLKMLDDPSFKGASKYGHGVYGTWDLSFKAIHARATVGDDLMDTQAAKSAILIFQTFAFFHHENIMEDIFKQAAEALPKSPYNDDGDGPNGGGHSSLSLYISHQLLQLDKEGNWDPLFFRKGIHVLLSFSLVKRNVHGHVYSVHPLVHRWSRDKMSKPDQQSIGHSANALLSHSITYQFASQDYAFCRMLLPHIKANYQHAVGAGVGDVYNVDKCARFALVYYESGYWKEAEELEVEVLETRKRVLGAGHSDTLASMGNLGSIYRNQGRWKEAEELEVQVLETGQRVLGAEHPDTLTSMANLASTYRNQGRWQEAEELEVQVMETRKRVLGVEHPDTLASMANLASTYRNQGRWQEAEELEVQVLETGKRILGAEHPDTLRSMANLALTYSNQGWWKEAEKLEVQVLETGQRVLGEEHPDTLTSMANLASTYWNQGRWKEAEELEVQVMETRKRVLGAEHPDTLTSMANLASTYKNQGQWKDAEELEVQVLESRERVLGTAHPDTLTSKGYLAVTHRNLGQLKQAEGLNLQVTETNLDLLEVPRAPCEPLSFSIDLFPLEDLVGQVPECDPQPQYLLVDLHPLHELLSPIPDIAPQPESVVVDLHTTDHSPTEVMYFIWRSYVSYQQLTCLWHQG